MTIHRAYLRSRLAAWAVVAFSALSCFAAPDAGDPLEALQPAIARQDDLTEKQQWDALVAEARTKAREGTPESLYLLGRALGNSAVARQRVGDKEGFKKLIEESQHAFEDSRDAGVVVFAPSYLGLARCCRLRGEFDVAITHLRQALKVSPGFKAAAVDLAEVCLEAGRGTDAEFVAYKLLEARPTDPDARVLVGTIKLAKGRPAEAEQEFRAAVKSDPKHPMARRMLAGALMSQRNYAEAAENLTMYLGLQPKDEEAWRVLFLARLKLKDRKGALLALESIRRELPGTEIAIWAATVEEEYKRDPEAFEQAEERTPKALAQKLESKDEAVVRQALGDMRQMKWDALPAGVYRLLAPQAGSPEIRRLAVQLISGQEDARTLTILEILLFHPREADPDVTVRREAARGLASLPTAGIVPVLWRALDSGDEAIREAAVRGIAAITGKYFRERLEDVTPADKWTAERARYETWWREQPAASIARREAVAALAKIFGPIQQGRKRLAEYCLPALDDGDARTWRAGYDLFRSLTAQDFGAAAIPESGEASSEERARITKLCREWFAENANKD